MNKESIIKILHDIEENESIEILYACEAGSRIWGFANDSSDFDIRFIYKKADSNDYLSMKQLSDVIECRGDRLDIVGWDIRKAFKLHYKNNPNLREWLLSSIVYIDKGILKAFKDLGDFDISILKNHYASIALKHWKKYCSLEFKQSKTKKYLYVIRSILCWNILDRGFYPPITIFDLINHSHCGISDDVKNDINDLINCHQKSFKISEDAIFRLTNFILNSLAGMKKVQTVSFKDIDEYDLKLKELLSESG